MWVGGGGGGQLSKNLSIVRNIGNPSIFLYFLITLLTSHHSLYIVQQEDLKKEFQKGKKILQYLAGELIWRGPVLITCFFLLSALFNWVLKKENFI
jgi:hypothetical protein